MTKFTLGIAVAVVATSFSAVGADKSTPQQGSVSFVCTETGNNMITVPAETGVAIDAPACPAGYTIVSGGCGSSNPPAMSITEIDTNIDGFGCEFSSNSPQQESVWAYGHCCKVEVKKH